MPAIYSTADLSERGAFSSYNFTIKNALKVPLKKAALAWLDWEKEWTDSWGDPVNFPTSIAPGRSATIKMPTKLHIVSFKMKWFVNGKYQLIERERASFETWCYFTEVELTVDDWAFGPWFTILRFTPVPPPK